MVILPNELLFSDFKLFIDKFFLSFKYLDVLSCL